jgi:SAM-dependent methyltransferase
MSTMVAKAPASQNAGLDNGLALLCPQCRWPCGTIDFFVSAREPVSVLCEHCGFVVEKRNGVWRALTPGQQQEYAGFLRDYESIRLQEGRGSESSDFYLALPFRDLTGRFAWQWKIRAKSYCVLEKNVLAQQSALRVLDLGAGNGWLSYRLALQGHTPVAVDLSASAFDGLEAARHYSEVLPCMFPRFQAAMDCLPFADEQFDLAIFDASFHYSVDYKGTLAETMRCLRRGGAIVIMDSPTYNSMESGMTMKRERHQAFREKYGFSSDRMASQEFVTPDMMDDLSHLGILWRTFQPWYGFGWAMRPWIARWKRHREPSQFILYVGRVVKP